MTFLVIRSPVPPTRPPKSASYWKILQNCFLFFPNLLHIYDCSTLVCKIFCFSRGTSHWALFFPALWDEIRTKKVDKDPHPLIWIIRTISVLVKVSRNCWCTLQELKPELRIFVYLVKFWRSANSIEKIDQILALAYVMFPPFFLYISCSRWNLGFQTLM